MARPLRADSALLADGGEALLLGNEAIVRGALEAGVAFATGYPGTPSSEVTDAFAALADELGIGFEYAVNEKIAVELAYAASLAGARSLVAMKHLGLSSAGDPLSTIPYMGVGAGMVVVSAGDPGCHTSPNEQDQRHVADMLHLPALDPSTPDEALRLTRFAFELSEACKLPVLLRPTTRVCHARAPVRLGPRRAPTVRGFVRDPARLLPVPVNARRLRGEIEGRLERARRAILADGAAFSRVGQGRLALLSSGAAAALCADVLAVLREHGLARELSFLRVAAVHPLPVEWLVEQLRGLDELLVVEELSPFLEDALRSLTSVYGLPVRILGQRTGHVPTHGELSREAAQGAVERAFGLPRTVEHAPAVAAGPPVPARPPILCSGCPHRAAFVAVKAVFGDDALMFNDIGCYTLGASPPFDAGDALLSMGSGIALAAGVSRMLKQRTVAFLGDSTFFHSGMPALLDVVKEEADVVTVVLDNDVTAMTGFQTSPLVQIGAGKSGGHGDARVRRRVDIANIVRALGVSHVERVDPLQVAATHGAFERARAAKGPSVLILERPCPVFLHREGIENPPVVETAPAQAPARTQVDNDTCRTCGRQALGHRCRQPVMKPFERSMARARSLEVGNDPPRARPAVAPCASQCPLFLCIQGYATHIAAGQYAHALELILDGLPLPEAVCRVCHRPCERVCVRASTDEPVAINELKRFVVEWANEHPTAVASLPKDAEHGRTVAVVGAGPAGLAAAYDLRARGYRVALFDARTEAGGLLRWGIPAYRLPKDALARDLARVTQAGVELHLGRALGANLALDELLAGHDAVVLAHGAWRPGALVVPGEGDARVVDALAFLERAGEGTASNVLVIGGGNSAIDAARTALRKGARAVSVACLEAREDMPAITSEIEAAVDEGVRLLCRTKVSSRQNGGVLLCDVEKTDPRRVDPGAFRALAGTERALPVELIVLAIGQQPDLSMLEGAGLAQSAAGALAIDEGNRTSHARVFAAGDLVERDRSVTSAIASGRRAAWGVDAALRGSAEAARRPPPPRPTIAAASSSFAPRRSDPDRRVQAPLLPASTRTGSFDEVEGRISEEAARREAERCLVCGQCGNCSVCTEVVGCPAFYVEGGIHIDRALCIDCRLCVSTCPNGAIA
ncbi:MAG: FAD-dependent oxidoreductase [Deltaproteobacteria bacterium]|nr:FAD-dependent oxidoreductase [Deltaproteobacteria bacterium]